MKMFPFRSILGLVLVTRVCWCLTSLRISIPYPIKVGDTVTLTCDYDLEGEQLYAIKWYWEESEFFRFVPRESPPFKTFPLRHIIVDVSGSDRNKITLKNVHKVMSGRYTCEVSADAPTFHTEMKVRFMQVYELPVDNLTMIVEPSKVEVGKPVKARCRSPHAYPAPTLFWYINNETVHYNGTDTEIENYRDTDLRILSESVHSKLQIIINQSYFDHNGHMELRCTGVLEKIWNSSVSKILKDETPLFAPVLGSTSSQIDDSDQQGNFDKLMNNALKATQTSFLYVLVLIQVLLVVR